LSTIRPNNVIYYPRGHENEILAGIALRKLVTGLSRWT
jgi:hypothetical protein